MASTAISGLLPTSASARELTAGWSSSRSPEIRRLFDLLPDIVDSRMDLVAAALRSTRSPFGNSVASAMALQEQSSQASTVRRFDIPAGPLGDVLRAFERVTGMHMTFAIESIGSIQSPGVSGALTVERALQAMVSGTGSGFVSHRRRRLSSNWLPRSNQWKSPAARREPSSHRRSTRRRSATSRRRSKSFRARRWRRRA